MLQFLFNIPPEVLTFIGGVISGLIPEFIRRYKNSKERALQERETVARIDNTEGSTRSLRVRDDLATGEAVGRMLGSLIEMGDKLSEFQDQQWEIEQLKTRLKLAQHFNKRLKGLLDAKGIAFSDADKLQLHDPE